MNYVMWIIFIIIIWAIIILSIIKYAFKGEKCPKCKEYMYEYYDEKEKTFYLECPKCGHKKTIKM